MLKKQSFRARKAKVRGSFSIFRYFQTVRQIHAHSDFYLVISINILTGHQNSKNLKYWANDEPGFMTGLFYSTKILLKT